MNTIHLERTLLLLLHSGSLAQGCYRFLRLLSFKADIVTLLRTQVSYALLSLQTAFNIQQLLCSLSLKVTVQ